MKVSVNAILTTLVGGCPVTTDPSVKATEKLYEENRVLNANLPYFEAKGMTREELLRENLRVKSDRIYKMLPVLEEMKEEIDVARASLTRILEKGKGIDKQYTRICEILITDAEELVLSPKQRAKTVDMKFKDEVSM